MFFVVGLCIGRRRRLLKCCHTCLRCELTSTIKTHTYRKLTHELEMHITNIRDPGHSAHIEDILIIFHCNNPDNEALPVGYLFPCSPEIFQHFPLFPKIKILNFYVPCSQKLPLFPCYLHFLTCGPLFSLK